MEAYLIAIGIFAGIYLLLALGLNLQFGMTGLINFGHVGFFCIGAYTSALLATNGVPVALSLAAGGFAAMLAAWPLGVVSIRLREDYFAIASLGFSEIVRLVVTSEGWLTKGVQGIPGIPRIFPGVSSQMQSMLMFGLVMVLCLLAILAMRRIVKSPFGRMIEAIRDNEEAVRSLGKEPAGFKMQVLLLGSLLAGVAGGLYAHYIGYISPDQFIPFITFQIWMAIIMGGVGRISGTVAGVIILMTFLEGSRFLRDVAPFIPEVAMASIRLGVIGLALMLFTIYRPQGLMGDYTKR
ncbi:branched-chain amino acid ABC transporter permease [Roseibium suaedae]|uniref:Branched-chain amino acid transport system permease protein n=1 Tax=Roseibium suaedae TaxID=735517 RepID=A0A1M7HZF5_9HYPH|nr:branched-chain amino acid ABC transporter permease [Roseibium suaedae]SHM33703.1 branched-chain amino acid transport system permease protein [Roseibium suaedae]